MRSNRNEGLHKEKQNEPAGYLMNSSQHGVGQDDEGDEAGRPSPQDRPTRPLAPSSVLNQYDKMASWPLVSTLYVRLR